MILLCIPAYLFVFIAFLSFHTHKNTFGLIIIVAGTKDVEAVQKELKEDEALPKLLVACIALVGLGLLIANTALVAWFLIRKRIKGKKTQNSQHESEFFLLFAFLLLVDRFFSVLFYLIFFFSGGNS